MKVRLITPQSIKGTVFDAYPFTEDNVKKVVDPNITCGFYRIGTVKIIQDEHKLIKSCDFRVCYFGRSDSNDYSLQSRICDHLASKADQNEQHVYSEQLYFSAWECKTSEDAYQMELADYQLFFSEPDVRRTGYGYMDNPRFSHDARSIAVNGCPAKTHVYVDNQNKPAQP